MKVRFESRLRVPRVPGWALATMLGWLSIVAFIAAASRVTGHSPVTCHVRAVTGLPCPTCGSTRAGLAILDGRFVDALLLNPMVVLLGLACAGVLGVRLIAAKQIVLDLNRRERGAIWVAAIAALVANWLYVLSAHGGQEARAMM